MTQSARGVTKISRRYIYWDFVFVENSEGAHNSKLTEDCLNKAEAIVDEALTMFKL